MAGLVEGVEATLENLKVVEAEQVANKEHDSCLMTEVKEKQDQEQQGEVGEGSGKKVVKDEKVELKQEEGKVVKEVGKVELLARKGDVEKEEENVKMEVEAKTGVSFPVKLPDGKELNSLGLRRKKVIAININIYAFGMYADNAKLKVLLKEKFGKAPGKATKELYEAVIDSDIGMVVRLVIVFGGLSMSMVRRNFDEGLGASLKKLNGGKKNDELINKVMGAAKDSIKLSSGSIIELTRLRGYILQTKVKGEVISEVQSELLCRAYFNMYLGDEPFDKEAKERFGNSLLSLF